MKTKKNPGPEIRKTCSIPSKIANTNQANRT